MKITAQTEAVSSPPEEKWHWSQQWRQNTFRTGQKLKADWKKDLHNLGAGRKSRKPPTPVVGMKPNGKSQVGTRMGIKTSMDGKKLANFWRKNRVKKIIKSGHGHKNKLAMSNEMGVPNSPRVDFQVNTLGRSADNHHSTHQPSRPG